MRLPPKAKRYILPLFFFETSKELGWDLPGDECGPIASIARHGPMRVRKSINWPGFETGSIPGYLFKLTLGGNSTSDGDSAQLVFNLALVFRIALRRCTISSINVLFVAHKYLELCSLHFDTYFACLTKNTSSAEHGLAKERQQESYADLSFHSKNSWAKRESRMSRWKCS